MSAAAATPAAAKPLKSRVVLSDKQVMEWDGGEDDWPNTYKLESGKEVDLVDPHKYEQLVKYSAKLHQSLVKTREAYGIDSEQAKALAKREANKAKKTAATVAVKSLIVEQENARIEALKQAGDLSELLKLSRGSKSRNPSKHDVASRISRREPDAELEDAE